MNLTHGTIESIQLHHLTKTSLCEPCEAALNRLQREAIPISPEKLRREQERGNHAGN